MVRRFWLMKKLVGGFNTLGTSYRIYYNEETDKYTLLTPYMLPDVKTIIQLTNQ